MKNILCVFIICLLGASLVSCAVKISEDEASKIINDHFGFPKPIMSEFIRGKKNSDIHLGIIKILEGGYAYKNPKASTPSVPAPLEPAYLPNDKGKPFIKSILFDSFRGEYTYVGAVAEKYLKEVNEILIDQENKIASVTYTTGAKAIDPFYDLVCKTSICRYHGENLNKTSMEKIKFKKYDKGWRVLQ